MVEFRHVSFTYQDSEETTLEAVDFSIDEGSLVFINGRSGSGKSTLLHILNGIIPEVIEGELEGDILIDGQKDLPIAERSLILGNVFQNPRSQFFTTNTTAEMAFAMENYGLPKAEMKSRLEAMVERYQVRHLLNRNLFEMSSGERQLIALLTVLVMDPKVLIFDEPSANLDYGNAMRLRRQLAGLKKEGKTVIVADHRCFYLQGMIDQVLLLRDKTIHCFDSEQDFLNSEYGSRNMDLFYAEYGKRAICRSPDIGIRIERLSYKKVLKDISLELHKNEVAVVIGVNGVGKTTLAELISGVLRPDEGRIAIADERQTEGGGIKKRRRNKRYINAGKTLYILQDADFQLFGATCLKELEINRKNAADNLAALELLHLGALKDQHPQSLSGGEKQRLQMAISLVSDHPIVILDEPTSGLDKASMDCVIEMIERLKAERTVMLISHDYELIRRVADQVIYLKEGTVGDRFYPESDSIERLNRIFREMEAYYE